MLFILWGTTVFCYSYFSLGFRPSEDIDGPTASVANSITVIVKWSCFNIKKKINMSSKQLYPIMRNIREVDPNTDINYILLQSSICNYFIFYCLFNCFYHLLYTGDSLLESPYPACLSLPSFTFCKPDMTPAGDTFSTLSFQVQRTHHQASSLIVLSCAHSLNIRTKHITWKVCLQPTMSFTRGWRRPLGDPW